ncbi:divergent polysaccharide deacetylase family protein [Paenibacillus agricola]|uniref:Divergent polysaccharide deacetylase family protein n=1 Tax=Paenibacillus agricola TaxID=2716264 RepID=A0ABX0J7S8_9BACL|nr:divergent polysaccharide deacetylase family protein [Paenibacillus agricola]NHN30129.1 divergent polysaccharide deacetylase family protein [Paenibacillus agricola]
MKKTLISLLLGMLLFYCPGGRDDYINGSAAVQAEESNSASAKKIAIVIDDFGNNMQGSDEIMMLTIPLTIAVMPFMPTTRRDAEWAHRLGHDVLIHMPMEPLKGKKSWLGPGAITTDMPDEEIRKLVQQAIADVPYAVGMNNHMGSKVTADKRVMRIVLEVCKDNNLMYLDSRTNYKSVVKPIAEELGVRVLENHIFMDDSYSPRHILKQLQKVHDHVLEHKATIAIGHVGTPGKYTAAALKQSLPALQQVAEFVTISKQTP